ncbi:NUDIX domain-containing protein [Gordonia sp. CPCC 206044]|uniref:NUDIX hydrolase n=1 Tax=Gordonia sp. CPCC 206044 TaxID=3140793 RepID=UPI003AF3F492
MGARILAVGAIIRDSRGRFLLVQRRNEPQAGCWTVPGGKVEPGESLRQAVVREVAEETGLTVVVGRRAWIVDIPDGRGGVFEVHDFVAAMGAGAAEAGSVQAGDDAADARWVASEDFDGLRMTDGLVDHLRRAGLLA